MAVKTAQQRRLRRRRRVRAKVRGSADRPRLAVYRSNRGLSAQLIDDDSRPHPGPRRAGPRTSSASSTGAERAKRAGELLAERAKAAGVETCVFDRGGYRFHGRVADLADGAREGGLKF